MRINARADYAVRSMIELAAAGGDTLVKAEDLALAQAIPFNFLENILGQLRRAGLVTSQRGPEGGFRLAKPPEQVALGDIIRAVDGPIARVRGCAPENAAGPGPAVALPRVWIALRQNVRQIVEQVTVADLVSGRLPPLVEELASAPEGWITRPIPGRSVPAVRA
jgi:Rrf2 family protein